jgi:RNA polymerase sigma-70 factor (sigma-E family)
VRAQWDGDYVAYVTGRLPVLRRVAAQLTGDPHRGDDLVQQAITRLYLRWRTAEQATNLDAYVYKILVRTYLDERRLGWSRVRLRDAEPDAVDPSTVDIESRLLLREALALLPVRQRSVVVLRFLADLSVDEVAEILGISPGTVKSQSSAAIASLRRHLIQQPDVLG